MAPASRIFSAAKPYFFRLAANSAAYGSSSIDDIPLSASAIVSRGGAPIGAGGVMTPPPTFRGKGGLGDIIWE